MKKIIIFGGSGLLGIHASSYFSEKNYEVFSCYLNHRPNLNNQKLIQVNILDHNHVFNILNEVQPDIILNCSGLTSVEECEKNQETAQKLHEDFPEFVSKFSSDRKIKNIHISTDHLWDGNKSFYKETDEPNPINWYGKTKANGEKKVIQNDPNSLIIRTNFFGKGTEWRESFSDWAIRKLKEGANFFGFDDVFYTPISIPLLLVSLNDLINLRADGIYQIAGSERISKYEFILAIAEVINLSIQKLLRTQYKKNYDKIKRPLDMSLSTIKINNQLKQNMPTIKQSIKSVIE